LLVDSLSSISSAFSGEESRFRIYMEQLFRYLEANHISSFLIREEAHPAHLKGAFAEKGEAISFLSDGIITIYNVIFKDGTRTRAIEVLKMRGEEIDRRIVEAEIVTGKGFCVKGNLLKGDYILT
jgi:KaiC/GvpD/RAD55 family RecA-like ATPase